MKAQRSGPVLCGVVVALAAVGLLDALIGRVWDHVVLFAALVLVGLLGVAGGRGRRRVLTLRADLATALARRASLTGEPVEQLADRLVATSLDALEPAPPPPAGTSGTLPT